MRTFAVAAFFLARLTAAAAAATAPTLPPSAEKLTADQITALYDGNTYTFTSYTRFGVATGTVTYDFKANSSHGTYKLGWYRGTISGRIHMDGDKFCYKVSIDREHCDFLYQDGDTIYDVDPDGAVQSVNEPQVAGSDTE
jgi:hypothetical protein